MSALNTFKAIVAYDGTEFYGFQIQAQTRTVQGELERALYKITAQPTRILAAGRTDTGVHASGQVVAFSIRWRHSSLSLLKALNNNLPRDIVVLKLKSSPADFHPRFDAQSRQYRYTILNQAVRDVLRRRYTTHIITPLDVESMQNASQHLLGTFDFAAFGTAPQGNNTVRTVTQAEWRQTDSELVFEITATAFLYRMVRNLVGTLIRVGRGKLSPAEFNTILHTQNRRLAGPAAKARGLCLVNVSYPAGW